MLNFRKLRQDYSPSILKEGRSLHDKKMVVSAKIVKLNANSVRVSSRVSGNFENTYTCEIEVDRHASATIDADCDCTYKYDCHHLAAVLFFLEERLDELVVNFSKDPDMSKQPQEDDEDKHELSRIFKEAESKETVRRGKKNQKELLTEYISASKVLGQLSFFLPEEELPQDKAELAVIFDQKQNIEIQLALRLPYRSKPLAILNLKEFLDAVRFEEPIYLGSKRYFFGIGSFDPESGQILKLLMDYVRPPEPNNKGERNLRTALIDAEPFGALLAAASELVAKRQGVPPVTDNNEEGCVLPCLYKGTLEEPLRLASSPARFRFELEYVVASSPKILLKPKLILEGGNIADPADVNFFECAQPGIIHQQTYYRFPVNIRRRHLRHLKAIKDVTIPQPLFGTFVENSLSELMRFVEVANKDIIERFVTLPFVGRVGAECNIHYLNGELEATLEFVYDRVKIPASHSHLSVEHILTFATEQGILARNLTEEQKIIQDLFQDFTYDESLGAYLAKNDRKIVEFMTEVIPRNQDKVKFHCPENLLDQFIYDESTFKMVLRESDRIDLYEVDLTVEGHLKGVTLDLLWECLSSRRAFIELASKKIPKKKNESEGSKNHKILVLDLERLSPVVQIFDEIGINILDNHKELRPLWSLANIDAAQFEGLPIKFEMSDKLKLIQRQMLGLSEFNPEEVPKAVQATLRSYQLEGVHWLERLRHMHLNGILADDMGLGKTLQAIIAITQNKIDRPNGVALIICPTSLVYNWKEEFNKFNPELRVLPVDGTPIQRKKLLNDINHYDVIITSYSLLQKDIEFYKTIPFNYAILDEAQHIKNRGTRNAKSVKMIQADHRLILTGTPIENSLEELWSLFDFLMPGLLSSYDRFIERYLRNPNVTRTKSLEVLRRKVSPFILRRMKRDVLAELPPVSEIPYHCHLTEVQRDLYRSYANSAREELSQLVKKEGFDRVQIHVLATLTRLKQICCHPAIFAKEKPETGDSAKYDMLMELLQTLIEGKHKTVIFSQYTRMLQIMHADLTRMGIKFEYLDGSSKNRLSIVKKFNEDETIPVFLVSLKAGGSGLNLVGADTVIHYDMWWNPAVENQATDRVHRLGQQRSVASYKLVTLDTIEEKIIQLQNRKKELVQQVVACDEEAIAKLTWEEVLELLQT